jgi:hypothetical protein
MRHFKAITAALAGAAALTAAGLAQAGPAAETWEFYDCTGPAGTPDSFSAWRTSHSVGNALHLVDGSGTFAVLYAYNEDAGQYNHRVLAPGLTDAAVVRCSTIGPRAGVHFTVWGILTS